MEFKKIALKKKLLLTNVKFLYYIQCIMCVHSIFYTEGISHILFLDNVCANNSAN